MYHVPLYAMLRLGQIKLLLLLLLLLSANRNKLLLYQTLFKGFTYEKGRHNNNFHIVITDLP